MPFKRIEKINNVIPGEYSGSGPEKEKQWLLRVEAKCSEGMKYHNFYESDIENR